MNIKFKFLITLPMLSMSLTLLVSQVILVEWL